MQIRHVKKRPRQYRAGILIVVTLFIGGLIPILSGRFEKTSMLTGRVIEKNMSCSKEVLQSDTMYKNVAGLCDGGNNLVIGSSRISTGGGAKTAGLERITDISGIHPGDIVEVKYVNDANGYMSTSCHSCYVRKLEPQKR